MFLNPRIDVQSGYYKYFAFFVLQIGSGAILKSHKRILKNEFFLQVLKKPKSLHHLYLPLDFSEAIYREAPPKLQSAKLDN